MSNQINDYIKFMKSGGKPEQFVQGFASKNPQFSQAYDFMKNQATSHQITMQEVALQIAKQNGIDPAFLQDMADKMGCK